MGKTVTGEKAQSHYQRETPVRNTHGGDGRKWERKFYVGRKGPNMPTLW